MAITPAAQATPDADADERAPYAQLFDAHWHSTDKPDAPSGRQCITVQLDTTGQQITLALDMASVRLLHITTHPGYFGRVLDEAHPTRSAPHCANCRHQKPDGGSVAVMCNHPRLPVDVVTGTSTTSCYESRRQPAHCGPEGSLFQPQRTGNPEDWALLPATAHHP